MAYIIIFIIGFLLGATVMRSYITGKDIRDIKNFIMKKQKHLKYVLTGKEELNPYGNIIKVRPSILKQTKQKEEREKWYGTTTSNK